MMIQALTAIVFLLFVPLTAFGEPAPATGSPIEVITVLVPLETDPLVVPATAEQQRIEGLADLTVVLAVASILLAGLGTLAMTLASRPAPYSLWLASPAAKPSTPIDERQPFATRKPHRAGPGAWMEKPAKELAASI